MTGGRDVNARAARQRLAGVFAALARHPGLVVFTLALLARAAWVLTLPERLMWIDEEEFVAIARGLAAGEGFVSTSYRANPTLSLYLGLVFAAFGESYLVARLGQCLIGALTCVIVQRTGTALAGHRVGLASGVLLALYPPHVYLSGVFYVDCLFIFCVSVTLLAAVLCVLHPGRLGLGVVAGLAAAASVYTRPVFVVALPFISLAWIVAAWPRGRLQVPVALAFCLTTVLAIVPWTVRNYLTYGRVIPVASGFATILWQGNNELSAGDADDRFLFWGNEFWTPRLARLDPAERAAVSAKYAEVEREVAARQRVRADWYLATDPVLAPIVLEYMRSHPWRTVELFGRKLVTLYAGFSNTYMTNEHTSARNRRLAAMAFYPILALAIVGAFVSRREVPRFLVIHAFIVALSVTYATMTACTRYRLPIDPYLIVLAAVALVRAAERQWTWLPDRLPASLSPLPTGDQK